MYRRPPFTIPAIGPLVAFVLLAAGCAQIRMPAIDPSGERLFLPGDSYTTLVTPSAVPCIPEAAYESPAPAPPCGVEPSAPIIPATGQPGVGLDGCGAPVPSCGVAEPACGVPEPACGAAQPSCGAPVPSCGAPQPPPAAPPVVQAPPPPPAGRILLAPQRLMAPVGSEVILVSGLVGKRGEYDPRQPIEWTIAPDSVGHLLTTCDDRDCSKQLFHHASHRRSGSQAITWSSASPEVLTRGTPTPADDVQILRGQSWVTVMSPSEGTTHVTVLAPKAENWDQRRQTATIYWVDVQWTLPAPAIVQATQPHTLTTLVHRSSGKPQSGWIVHYQILQPGSSSFGQDGQTSIEVPTDEAGRASANLIPANRSQSCQIEIKIIRPSDPNDDLPRMVVGRGFTTVTWSAPDPKVTLYGPETAPVGGTASYRADISNAGDIVARDVVASTTVPANMTFLQSEPPAQVMGNRLVWNLGNLAPTEGRSIAIHLRPERNADVRFCVRAASGDQLQGQPLAAEACVQTRVFSSALSVRLIGPQSARVGDQVPFEIEVTNTGTEPLTNVLIRDRLPAGLELPGQPGGLIERTLTQPLPAGTSQKIELPLVVRSAGRLCQVVEAFASGGHSASTSACVEATQPAAPQGPPPQAGVQVKIEGPLQSRVGQLVTYSMSITNSGNVPLTGVRIVNTYEPSLYPKEASRGFDQNALRRGELVWTVERIEPGESVQRESKYECLRETTAAWSRVYVESAEDVRATRETTTQILAAETAPRRPVSPPAQEPEVQAKPEPVTGQLRVAIADTTDPLAVNSPTTYIISVENARNVSDRQISMTIYLPPGLEYVGFRGPVERAA